MFTLSVIAQNSPLFWALISSVLGAVGIWIISIVIKHRTNKLLNEPVPAVQKEVLYTATQLEELQNMLKDTGYAYDYQQDIFYSLKNPWQKRYGYCRLYDESAAPLGMIFDCEPVCFEYRGKHWMIELWKGQYGMTTGAEIGIYNTDRPEIDIPELFAGTIYDCAGEAEYLNMAYTLIKNGKVLYVRADRHWWLTGFKLGMFSKPSSLTMVATITFPDMDMRTAFLEGLRQLGYRESEFHESGLTVTVVFTKPYSRQPLTRRSLVSFIALQQDKRFVREYRRLTKGLQNMYEILLLLKKRSPLLYSLIMKVGRQKEMYSQHETIKQYIQ